MNEIDTCIATTTAIAHDAPLSTDDPLSTKNETHDYHDHAPTCHACHKQPRSHLHDSHDLTTHDSDPQFPRALPLTLRTPYTSFPRPHLFRTNVVSPILPDSPCIALCAHAFSCHLLQSTSFQTTSFRGSQIPKQFMSRPTLLTPLSMPFHPYDCTT